MKKVRASLPQKRWAGLVTKYPAASDYVSPDEFTTGSKNLDTNVRGVVTKRLGGVTLGSGSTAFRDQFEAIFVDGTRHLLMMDNGTLKYTVGDGVLTSVVSGYTAAANMEFGIYQDRVYFGNGVSAAQVYDRTVSYGGASSLPVTLTVVSYAGLAGDTVTIGTTTLTAGVEWTAGTSNDATATSLAAAIDALSGVAASAVGPLITVTSETPHIVRLSDAVNLTIASVVSPRVKAAGAQVPTSALSAATGAGGNVPADTYTYKVTFLYYDSEESNGGTTSGSVSPGVSSQIDLTAIPIGGYGVTARKIYRDDGTGVYRLVLTIANNTATTGTDNVAAGTTIIPEDNGVPPQFKYIAQHLDRFAFAGVSGRSSDLFFTEAGLPDIVLSTGFVTCNSQDPITGVIVYQDRWLVFNRTSFGQIFGSTSDTFRYAPVPGNVGCVDNRSIQVRTINGVPTVVWLSDKGFYMFNGSTVDYISDSIETLVNLNLQQADFARGSNTDSEEADFTAGTASAAIVLDDPSGSITVPNPKSTYDTQAAWEDAEAFANLVTKQTATQDPSRIGTPLGKTFDYDADEGVGTANVELEATELTLTQASDNTSGGSTNDVSVFGVGAAHSKHARAFTFARAGTLTGVSVRFTGEAGWQGHNFQPRIWADSLGTFGSVLASGSVRTVGAFESPASEILTFAPALSISAGQTIWIGLEYLDGNNGFGTAGNMGGIPSSSGSGSYRYEGFASGTVSNRDLQAAYTFTQTAVPASGTWVSDAVNVGFLADATTQTVYLDNTSATYPAGCSSITYIDTSDDETFGSGVSTASVNDLDGADTATIARKKYFRVRVELETTDDREVPVYGELSLGFGDEATWTSTTIDHTTDLTALNSLVVTASLPAGTSGSVTIQKSSDDITYNDEGTIALANGAQTLSLASITNPTLRYTRVMFTLTGDDNTATAVAQVSSAVLKWTTVSTFQSAEIDVGSTPAGWDIFTTETTTNGGTVAYTMKSATSSGGLGAASYEAVTSGAFPSAVTPNRHAKWKATITATADANPQIDSVTVAWFLSSSSSPIRAASLFYNKAYYIALAESEETANNIVLVFDENRKWYRYEGVSVATMGLFFNRPLVGLASAATLVRWLSGQTDQGTNITMDVRTKALDFGDPTKTKVLRGLTVLVANTGTTWAFTYSVDDGNTFLPLVDYTGSSTFATSTDGELIPRRLVPQWPAEISGRTILIRGVSSDAFDAHLYQLYIDAFIRESEPTHV